MQTRRYFLKTVLLGAAAASIPRQREAVLGATPPLARTLRGDHFDVCHAVRDGAPLRMAEPRTRHDVVVVGGGPSGLSAAYCLLSRDVLLLEKEEELGGNCILDGWEGVRLSTGGAFYTESETELLALFKSIGAQGTRIKGDDSLVVDGVPYLDFFKDGADRLPFPPNVRADFRRSRTDLLKILETRTDEDLDRVPFADLLRTYDPVVTRFWDRFGRSNWGSTAEETSAAVGCAAYRWAGDSEDPRWTFPGGMAAPAAALADFIRPKMGASLVTGAAVFRIEVEGKDAVVHYMKDQAPHAVRARAVVVAVPKFYASHVVLGLPEDQRRAMHAVHFEPYAVFNVCLKSPGPEPAYDNWFLDAPFTDFIPADWIVYAGKGPKDRKSALTVYHPLPEGRRAELLSDEKVLEMADAVAATLEGHFPGTIDKIAEIRVFRRGHPMCACRPGFSAVVEAARQPFGPVFFAATDSVADVSSFSGALRAAREASEGVFRRLKA